ncbi:MAG: glycosyl hydrolase-related protein, partial [Pirellulales bacterium]
TTETDLSTSMAADALFSMPLVYEGEPLAPKFDWRSLGSLNPSWCAPSVSEPAAYFVRLHETAGQAGTARLQLRHAATQAELVDLLERPLATLKIDPTGAIAIPYRPWQILTVRISGADA